MLWGRWEYEFIIDLKEISVNTTNWIDSAKDRDYSRVHVNEALNLRVP